MRPPAASSPSASSPAALRDCRRAARSLHRQGLLSAFPMIFACCAYLHALCILAGGRMAHAPPPSRHGRTEERMARRLPLRGTSFSQRVRTACTSASTRDKRKPFRACAHGLPETHRACRHTGVLLRRHAAGKSFCLCRYARNVSRQDRQAKGGGSSFRQAAAIWRESASQHAHAKNLLMSI